MNEKPVVSVVTICYNAGSSIGRVIESVLKQTYREFEYIIKDGGSTDGTKEIVTSYQKKFDEKGIPFTYISKKDSGIYDAMNQAVAVSSGTWVNFMNADDRFYDAFVLNNIFAGNHYLDSHILYGDALECEFGEYYLYPKYFTRIEQRMPFSHQATFAKKEVLERFPFRTDYKIGSDYNFLLQAYRAGLVFTDIGKMVCVVSKEGVSTVNLYDTFVETAVIRKENGIVLYTEKEYKKQLKYVKLKQFGMYYFPNWLKYLIRKIQRKLRGQNGKVDYRED